MDFRIILLYLLLVWTIECRSYFNNCSSTEFLALRTQSMTNLHRVHLIWYIKTCIYRHQKCSIFSFFADFIHKYIWRLADHQFTCVIKQVRRWMFSQERIWAKLNTYKHHFSHLSSLIQNMLPKFCDLSCVQSNFKIRKWNTCVYFRSTMSQFLKMFSVLQDIGKFH